MTASQYIIRGGVPGRERLRLLARVMRPTTLALLKRMGVHAGMKCLDVGCGGGDVALDLARLVGPQGEVVGIDMDATKLDLARNEASSQRLEQVSFQQTEIDKYNFQPVFDLVYARFLLTHLSRPERALRKMHDALRPGGVLVIEDIDFSGHFCWPDCAAFRQYIALYAEAAKRQSADPNIGPRLPRMLLDVGCAGVQLNVVQPASIDGEVKLVAPLTLENIADAVIAAELASRAELDCLIAELYEFARDPRSVMSIPRVVQAWGYRSAAQEYVSQ
jgi:ubiquinone/menaquinone biosynthesis C-methylase UbiE